MNFQSGCFWRYDVSMTFFMLHWLWMSLADPVFMLHWFRISLAEPAGFSVLLMVPELLFGFFQNYIFLDVVENTFALLQFHLTLKCTKGQSSHFCHCVLVSKWIFKHHDGNLTIFHAESEQLLVCVVKNNSTYLTVKNNSTIYHAFRTYWM